MTKKKEELQKAVADAAAEQARENEDEHEVNCGRTRTPAELCRKWATWRSKMSMCRTIAVLMSETLGVEVFDICVVRRNMTKMRAMKTKTEAATSAVLPDGDGHG